jgi:pimeloyl-ACP methyl ester carboxylesterase
VTLVEIDGAGHGVVVEHPARIADEVVTFFKGQRLGRRR